MIFPCESLFADSAGVDELLNTPRSLQACLNLGIDPSDIQNRCALNFFICPSVQIHKQNVSLFFYGCISSLEKKLALAAWFAT